MWCKYVGVCLAVVDCCGGFNLLCISKCFDSFVQLGGVPIGFFLLASYGNPICQIVSHTTGWGLISWEHWANLKSSYACTSIDYQMIDPSIGIQFAAYANDLSVSRKQHSVTHFLSSLACFDLFIRRPAEHKFLCSRTEHPNFVI